jgi:hypothetical protein
MTSRAGLVDTHRVAISNSQLIARPRDRRALPAVSFLGGFRTPALVPVDRSALAGIRNLSQERTPTATFQAHP